MGVIVGVACPPGLGDTAGVCGVGGPLGLAGGAGHH